MSRSLADGLRVLVPASIAGRGVVFVLLLLAALCVPTVIGLAGSSRANRARCDRELEALLAATLQNPGLEQLPDAERRATEAAQRLRWAALYAGARCRSEWRAGDLRSAEIEPYLDFDSRTAASRIVQLADRPQERLRLLMFPQAGGALLAAVVQEQPGNFSLASILAASIVLLSGIGAAWAWFVLTIERPVRRAAAALVSVQEGRADVTQMGVAPAELRQFAAALAGVQEELHHWRGEAASLRYTLDARVDARTRRAEAARRRAEHDADTDPLTRLGSRRVLERELPRLFAEHARERRPLAVILLDLDRFKLYNDTLGHQAGDRLLSFVGELIRATVRKGTDVGIRYGGDEFAILLPDTTATAAAAVATRLIQLFAQWARTVQGLALPPGLSAGVAERVDCGAATADELVRAADRALYAQKSATAGRRHAGPPDGGGPPGGGGPGEQPRAAHDATKQFS